jgi:hypothetical protein
VIWSTDLIPKQAQDFDLNIVEPFAHVMNLPLHHHADAVNACQKLEDPAQGWLLRRVVEVMRYRCLVVGSWLAQAALRQRIHQHSQRHHRQYPLHPTGFLTHRDETKNQGALRNRHPPSTPAWAL